MIHIIDYMNTDVRHMDHWRTVVPLALEDAGYEVNIITGKNPSLATTERNLLGEVYYKTTQFNSLYEEIITSGVSRGDIFIVGDAWNPTMVAFKYIQLILNIDVAVIGLWRDGTYDIHSKIRTGLLRKPKRWAKSFERSLYDSYDHNCFITESQRKRFLGRYKLKNIPTAHVTGLPYEKLKELRAQYIPVPKEDIIILPHDAVDTDQRDIFNALKKHLKDFVFIDCHELNLSSSEYYSLLNRAKAVMAINLSETDPTNIYEGMLFGCVPIVPDALIYAEAFPEQYWYPSHYTQPPFLNFVRGRVFMHDLIKNVMDTYEQIKPTAEMVELIGDKYFNNDELLKLVKSIEEEYVRKPRQRNRRQRKFKRR